MTNSADYTPAEARKLFRDGLVTPTAGWCAGWTQANLLALPRDLAYDFLLFTQRNPKPCPVLDVLDRGAVSGPILDGDVRTDLPAYRVYVDLILESRRSGRSPGKSVAGSTTVAVVPP